METLTKKQTKVAIFNIGRGGRFYNSGYLTCKLIADSFDAEYFGINIYPQEDGSVLSEGGKIICTIDELTSDSGRIDIDGAYDTWYWKPVNELNEEELEAMVRDMRGYEYADLFENKNAIELIEELNLLSEYADRIDTVTIDDVIEENYRECTQEEIYNEDFDFKYNGIIYKKN